VSTIIFVHGTGVRRARFAETLGLVARLIADIRPDATIKGCFWGERFGAALSAGGASIPSGNSGRSAPDLGSPYTVDDISLWSLLYAEPTIEMAGARTSRSDVLPAPGRTHPGAELAERARQAVTRDDVKALADAAGLGATLIAAATALTTSGNVQDALADAELFSDLPQLLARAIVAEAVKRSTEEVDAEPPSLDGAARDALVEGLSLAIGPTLGGRGWTGAGGSAARVAWRLAGARAVERRRRSILDVASPLAGDVMLYLARGQEIRSFIAKHVREAGPGPVTLLAHSLGGVACVDLLASEPGLQVSKLITVGSQAPFLYEIGALPMLESPNELPEGFPPWTNVYDPRDLLAFVASGVFRGRARDFSVDSRQPFPWAHSAYWSLRRMSEILAAELP
jgi:hypothetical protein